MSGEYFQVLGVQAEIGRVLQPADDLPTAPAVAVISHGVWQRMFGGAPDVVGRLVKANGLNFGSSASPPRAFGGLFNSGLVPSALWLPLSTVRSANGWQLAAAGSGGSIESMGAGPGSSKPWRRAGRRTDGRVGDREAARSKATPLGADSRSAVQVSV